MPTPTIERWRQIEKVFDAALDLPPELRADFLDRSCARDDDLRVNVEQLLCASDSSSDFLERPLVGAMAPFVADSLLNANLPTPGDRVGAYRIINEAGRGGMGVVYVAERDDGVFQKRVALKLVRRASGTDDHLSRRFQEERQILASLEHPGIARLLDGGALPDGRPYFVMEYVVGTPIDRFADERGLDVTARLELFCKVCDAVEHAHQKQIIHRDLKPSNILVTTDAEVKLLDFGIATLVVTDGPHAPTQPMDLTQPAVRILTRDYASPEQLCGNPASPASDVYSLGIILYELLAGRHPYRRDGRSRSDARRIDEQPESPSDAVVSEQESAAHDDEQCAGSRIAVARRTTLQRLRRRLAGELDEIVLMALRSEPHRRYTSAGELAADVRRHIAGETIRARPERWPDRTRAFVRRHRSTSSVAALAVAATLVAAVVVARQLAPRASITPASSPSSVAVFPFTPAVADTALHRIGRELVSTLSAALNGMGDLRAVDAQTILARTDRAQMAASTQELSTIANDVGAGIVIRGTLARVGNRVRADGVLLRTGSTAPLANVSATAASEDLPALTDSLTWMLLHQLARIQGVPALGEAAASTYSLPALRAFLDGERLADEYRMRAATAAFARAIAFDSTFWIAYWRQAWTADFHNLPVDRAIRSTYIAHRADLPAPDRLLIESRSATEWNERRMRVESLLKEFPDYWPGSFELGELKLRQGTYAGGTVAEAEGPLRRTVALNRRFVPGWDRLLWVAIATRDTVTSARVLRELERLRYDSTSKQDDGFDILLLYRHLHHLSRTGGVPDPALADSVSRAFDRTGYRPSVNGMPDRTRSGIARFEFHHARIDLATRQLRSGVVPRPFQWHVIANGWASRGAWDSTMVASESAVNFNGPLGGLLGYRLATLGVWLGAVQPSVATAWRGRLEQAITRMRLQDRAELAWLDGLLATAQRDPAALARARRFLQRSGAPEAASLDSSLTAYASELAGDRRRALELLLDLERDKYRLSNSHPYVTGVNRLTAADWLSTAGDAAGAANLLTWHETVGDPAPHAVHANAVLAPFAYLARARLMNAQAQPDKARALYRRFLDNYDAPMPAHQRLVDEARAALTRIGQ